MNIVEGDPLGLDLLTNEDLTAISTNLKYRNLLMELFELNRHAPDDTLNNGDTNDTERSSDNTLLPNESPEYVP